MPCSEEEISVAGIMEVEGSLVSSCYVAPNLQEELKCSMCGDVGLPHYLFRCLTCSYRYQHIYCSKFYPHTIEATVCNWCLPMERPIDTSCEVDNRTNIRVSDIISTRNATPHTQANSNCLIDTQMYTLDKQYTKAFECLLRVAKLYEQGHQWDSPGTCICPLINDDCISDALSERNYVSHLQNHGNLCDVDHNLSNNQQPASSIFSGCRDKEDQSLYARRGGDKIKYASRPSSSCLAHPKHNHSHACMGPDQITGMIHDVRHPQTILKTLDGRQDLSHDQIRRKLSSNQDLGYIQTVQKLASEVDQEHELAQKLAIDGVNDHQVACMDKRKLHLMNSPSRAMKCRYKLLTDVLC